MHRGHNYVNRLDVMKILNFFKSSHEHSYYWRKWSFKKFRNIYFLPRLKYNIGFPAHFRHLFIQFNQFSIQFRPKKLTAFKSKVQFRQIVIHIRFLSIKFKNSSFKFVNCHWNSSLSLSELRMQGSNSSFFQTKSLFCHSNSSGVIGPLHLGDEFDWNFDENECQ